MAGLKDADDFKDGEHFKGAGLLKFVLGIVGFGGMALFLLLAFFWKDKTPEMAYSWLFAVVFFLSLSVGGLFWTLLHHASNSGWGTVVRRLMENLGSMIPFILILGVPFLIEGCGFRNALWEWFPEREAALHSAEVETEAHFAEYKADLEADVAKADAEVKAGEAAISSQPNLKPGEKRHLEDKLQVLKKQAAELGEEDLSDDAGLRAKLKDDYFREEAALLHAKQGFLNEGSWFVRYLLYFIGLTGVIFILRGWSIKQDRDGDPKWFLLMRRWSCGFLPIFAVSWTFLVFDWLMALDYTWFSTMWGVYLFAGAALNSMGLLVIVLTLLRRAGYLKNVVTMEHYHLMGKLMLAFTIFWAYIAFSQFFLIWYANITEETKFYLTRNTDFWNVYTITFLVIGHFFVPFAALLIQKFKMMPAVLSGIAVWNLIMHSLDIYWIIIPERGVSLTNGTQMTMPGAWLFDLLAFVSVAGIFGFFLLRQLGSASLFPCRDPRLDESLNVVN